MSVSFKQDCAISVIQCSFAADTSACYTEVQISAAEYVEVGVADKIGKQAEFLRIHGIFCAVEDIAHAYYVINKHRSVSADVELRPVLVIGQVFLYAFVRDDLYGIEYFIGVDTYNAVIFNRQPLINDEWQCPFYWRRSTYAGRCVRPLLLR